MGIVSIDVTSAVDSLRPGKGSEQRAGAVYEEKSPVRLTVDKAIKAGLVVRIGDTVAGCEHAPQLELLKARFLEGGPSTN